MKKQMNKKPAKANLEQIIAETKQQGIAPVIIIIIVVAIIALGTAGYFIFKGKSGVPGQQVKPITDPEQALAELTVQAPLFDFVLAPLGALKVSAFNLLMPNLPGNNIFPSFSTNTNFNYSGDTSIAIPTVTIDYTPPIQTTPTTPPANQQGGQQTDCAQFAAVPACSYVGAPDSQGYIACKQCYPTK
ncbi:MAG: hypothetical protein NTX82_00200 [Candidatus Parcubacteria bacterium]|nr:hypothetical protein [Candidatus Parcubacteria bacterium]